MLLASSVFISCWFFLLLQFSGGMVERRKIRGGRPEGRRTGRYAYGAARLARISRAAFHDVTVSYGTVA